MRGDVDIRMRLASLKDVMAMADEERQGFLVGQVAILLWLQGRPFPQAHVDADRLWETCRQPCDQLNRSVTQ